MGGERMPQSCSLPHQKLSFMIFRDNFNYFDALERAAEALSAEDPSL